MSDQPKPTGEHELKTWPQFFSKILDGTKPFEVRKNDRGFNVGDDLFLREWNPENGQYTGRSIKRKITYIYPADGYGDGVNHGYYVMGLSQPKPTGEWGCVKCGYMNADVVCTHCGTPKPTAVFTEPERCPRCKGTGFIGKAVDIEGKPIAAKPTGEQEMIALHTAAAKLAGADGIVIKPAGELGMKDGKPYPPPMDVICEDRPPDQSPKPTGQRLAVASEWTGLSLSRLIKERGYKGAADAHNAALSSEREKHRPSEIAGIKVRWPYDDEIQQLREQLAAAKIELAKVLTGEQLDAALAKIGAK